MASPLFSISIISPRTLFATRSRCEFTLVFLLLATHASLLAISATRHSPTVLEPAFLSSGLSHWQLGRFELFRVNPPLPRMIASLPLLVAGCKTDWRNYYYSSGTRAELQVGEDFIAANRHKSVRLFIYARWACIPFALLGAIGSYVWSRHLYGSNAGLLTLALWTFDPNLLAHGELVTSDCASWSFAIVACYFFSRWLESRRLFLAIFAGLLLGFAVLSKFTWLILVGAWPLLWCIEACLPHQRSHRSSEKAGDRLTHEKLASRGISRFDSLHAFVMVLAALFVVNLGYGFDGFGKSLEDLKFSSELFTGSTMNESDAGNRFQGTFLGRVPILVPEQFLLGIDSLQNEIEKYGTRSYLHGEWSDGGCWYYYPYGLLVKAPCGTCVLFLVVVIWRGSQYPRLLWKTSEIHLLLPASVLLFTLCSRAEFNGNIRYALPVLSFALVWIGQLASKTTEVATEVRGKSEIGRKLGLCLRSVIITLAVVTTVFESLWHYPHHLSFFNAIAGGPRRGNAHLLGSDVDWGQDFLYCLNNVALRKNDLRFMCYTSYDPALLLPPDLESLSSLDDRECTFVFSTNILSGAVNSARPSDGTPPFGTNEYRHLLQMAKRRGDAFFVTNTIVAIPGAYCSGDGHGPHN